MKTILVIEDEPLVRENLLEFLSAEDYNAVGAADGRLGLELAQTLLPDLVICDIMMPMLDGYDVCKALRQDPATEAIPFIFLSAKANRCDVRQGMNIGADDYLTKPFTTQELREAIAARFSKQAARQRAEQQLRESEAQFRQLAQREELLNRITQQIRNSLELKTILTTALGAIRKLLQIHRCRYFWYRTDVTPAYFELIHESVAPGFEVIAHHNPLQEVATLGEILQQEPIVQVDDFATDPRLDESSREHLLTLEFSSLLAVTIQTHAGKVGLVVCEQFHNARPWSHNEVSLLKAVGDQLAISIDQAELYTQSGFAATVAQIQARQLEKALSDLKQAQTQLIQTEKMSSLGQLVAGVAHEINNPVSFIYGNIKHMQHYVQDLLELLQLYKSECPNPSSHIKSQEASIDLNFLVEDLPKVLSSMQMGAERIRQIVLLLRNFSRLDEAEMKPVDIHEGLENTLLILQHRLKANSKTPPIQIIKCYRDLPSVQCYAGQLNQVFMNILTNAIDALEEGAETEFLGDYGSQTPLACVIDPNPQIRISTEETDAKYVTVRIADNGPGMTEEVKQGLFDPFFTTKPVGQGTGLGLSISYQIIVEKHKGVLECISELGKGTEFIITIPKYQV